MISNNSDTSKREHLPVSTAASRNDIADTIVEAKKSPVSFFGGLPLSHTQNSNLADRSGENAAPKVDHSHSEEEEDTSANAKTKTDEPKKEDIVSNSTQNNDQAAQNFSSHVRMNTLNIHVRMNESEP